MEPFELSEALEELRLEINATDPSDGAAKERLNQLISDIERRVQRSRESGAEERAEAEHADTLLDNIRDAIKQLELEHPRATTLLNQIMMTLGSAGI
jgi:uncharacterized protein (UPF0335 family)